MREELLFDWNPWWNNGFEPDAVERDRYGEVETWLERDEVVALTGARRSGKTTLLHITVQELLDEVPAENILFVKCDDDRVQDENVIQAARETYRELFDPAGKTYLFLDEVNAQDGWAETVKRVYDLGDEKIFVTGSRLLQQELGTHLAGRFARLDVYPFSFQEFLRANGEEVADRNEAVARSDEMKHLLREYVEWGGFPEIVLEDDEELKEELLQFYADTILYRDVVERSGIQKVGAVERLKTYALANVANPANYSSVADVLDVAADTVSDYLAAMEAAYFVFPVPVFSYSVKKQHRNPKKLYCIDTGIRNAAGFRFSEDIGRLYENAVFIELKRRGHDPYYWKDGQGREVDFVVQDGEDVTGLFQVSYDFKEAEGREMAGMRAGLDEFDVDEGYVLTNDTRRTVDEGENTIHVLPLWEWLGVP